MGDPQYGEYGGSRAYSSQQQQYEEPYQQQGGRYDDNFIEALAQRIAQQVGAESQGKLTAPQRSGVPPQFRMALAIVSVAILIPLAAILLTGAVSSAAGLLAFGVASAVIIVINIVFNGMAHR